MPGARVGGGGSFDPQNITTPLNIKVSSEVPAPPKDGTGTFFFIKDTESGKYQLGVIFPSGNVQIISTEM